MMTMTENLPKELTHEFYLTAAQCNAQRELAPAHLVQQIIEVATEHADVLGVGFRELQQSGCTWVLSRIAIEMTRYPQLLEKYSLTTWIEGYNRHFSERNFEIRGSGGETIGYARTIWVAINTETRRPADLTSMVHIAVTVSDRPCPIAKQSKIRLPEDPQIVNDYTFRVSDIDLNRHVTSARYVELILNQLPLNDYDAAFPARFEIEYKNEALIDESVTTGSTLSAGELISAITLGEKTIALGRMRLEKRG